MHGTGGGSSGRPKECRCTERFECSGVDVFLCVRGKKNFLEEFRSGSQISYKLCIDCMDTLNITCLRTTSRYNKTCSYNEGEVPSEESLESPFSCTFEEKNMKRYTLFNSVCKQDDCRPSTVNPIVTTDSTTAVMETTGVKDTLTKTTSYVPTIEQKEPITTKAKATSPIQPGASVTRSTLGLLPSTRLVTDNTVTSTKKMDTPAPSLGQRYGISVAVAVPLTLIFLLVALVIFVRWKKGGKRFCTKSRRKLNQSKTPNLNPDGSAAALRVNPTYDLDGRLANDVIHLASLASVQEEAGNYSEIPPREYESYRPNQHPATYTALQEFRSPGSDDNEDDDPPVYTPVPVNNKPAIKNGKADNDYVESVDAPPIVFSETPAASKTSFKEPHDQESTDDPERAYYFKLSRGTAGELDREVLDPSAADSGQYQSLEASSTTLPRDAELADEGYGYDMISRNAINLAKTAANAATSNYNHIAVQAAAHSNGANNAYDTVERPGLETAFKCGDLQQGATGGNIYNSTGLMKEKTAAYDVVARPGMKHSANTTGEGDYSLAMPIA